MARQFIGQNQINYSGAPNTNPIQICNGGRAVPLFFDWAADYNAGSAAGKAQNVNVKISLAPASNREKLLNQIASVYIDNTNSPVPIYVYCPDTRYSCVAQPNSAGWYPLYTNQTDIWVIAQGFVTGQVPFTTVFITDLFIPPYTDQEIQQASPLYLASANISKGNILFNKNYGIPSLGDQTCTFNITLNTPGFVVPINTFVGGSGFRYLKAAACTIAAGGAPATNALCAVQLVNQTLAGAFIWSWEWLDGGNVYSITPPGFSGLDLKFDAANQLSIFYSNGPSFSDRIAFFKIAYTTNPQ